MNVFMRCYEYCLKLLPRDFRSRYAEEMLETYRDLVRDASWRVAVAEISDVALIVLRLRAPRRTPAYVSGAVVTSLLLLFAYQQTNAQTIDFQAADPAGEFTLSIRRGKPVAASVDRVAIPVERLVHSGDSIRIVEPNGKVIVAVAFDRETSRIQWDAREVAQ